MDTSSLPLAAAGAGGGLLAVGIVVALLLVLAVWWGIRRRAAEPPPPRNPVRPPVHPQHVEERREPDGTAFPDDGDRLSPHDMKGYGNFGSRREGDEGPGA
ncbi:DUF6479 family protein [Streptomyces sp. NPDC089919]|uniref:DUF6479 family protein n=1 Tax=Streptomyces sp. NPDC089919 TaxID=3155188 RepID=UPI00342428DB